MAVQDHRSPACMKRSFISLMNALALSLPLVCGAQVLDMNALNASMSPPEVSGETHRDCDVCPNKAGHAVTEDTASLAKRCDTCSDAEVMGVEAEAVQITPDFTDYTDPSADSPESLKPF